jgi:hypothetical protein
VVDKAACRARAAGPTWEQIEVLPETEVEAKLNGVGPVTDFGVPGRGMKRQRALRMQAALRVAPPSVVQEVGVVPTNRGSALMAEIRPE